MGILIRLISIPMFVLLWLFMMLMLIVEIPWMSVRWILTGRSPDVFVGPFNFGCDQLDRFTNWVRKSGRND